MTFIVVYKRTSRQIQLCSFFLPGMMQISRVIIFTPSADKEYLTKIIIIVTPGKNNSLEILS